MKVPLISGRRWVKFIEVKPRRKPRKKRRSTVPPTPPCRPFFGSPRIHSPENNPPFSRDHGGRPGDLQVVVMRQRGESIILRGIFDVGPLYGAFEVVEGALLLAGTLWLAAAGLFLMMRAQKAEGSILYSE